MILREFKVWGRKREEKDSLYIWAKDADDAIGIARLTDQSICISQWTGNETTMQEITAEFAIEYLLDDCEDCPENKDGECMTQSHCFEVKQMAIKALEQEPCEDAISRQSMLDYLKYLHGEMPEEEFVKALPSVTPTRKKGKWVNKSHTSDCGIKFVASECTCCGKKTFFDCDQLVYTYCPNCGAEMEGEE